MRNHPRIQQQDPLDPSPAPLHSTDGQMGRNVSSVFPTAGSRAGIPRGVWEAASAVASLLIFPSVIPILLRVAITAGVVLGL